jgi:hypothetical protein
VTLKSQKANPVFWDFFISVACKIYKMPTIAIINTSLTIAG